MPTGTASRSAPPPAPGRTPPEPLPPVQTKGQSSSARRAVCPGLFFCPSSRRWPCCLPAAPDRLPDRCGSVTARPVRWPHQHPAAAADHPAHPHRQPEADRHQQHRQRRTDDPAAHKLHSLHTLPDLTAASSPPPAPTDTAPRQLCRPPAAADHPANSQKTPTAARRRNAQPHL